MNEQQTIEQSGSEETDATFLAGQKVPPGTYREMGTFRSIHLDNEDYLPASLNGRVAVYVKKPLTFAELLKAHLPFGKAS